MPRPISAWSKRYIKRASEIHMTSEIKIVRPAAIPAPDLDGVITAPTENDVIYQGKARIYEVNPAGGTNVGEIELANRSTNFSIPWNSSVPDIDDIIEVDGCPEDADLIGRSFRITGVSGGGQTMAVRRISASVLDENNAWR
jgi:hypothetical protein